MAVEVESSHAGPCRIHEAANHFMKIFRTQALFKNLDLKEKAAFQRFYDCVATLSKSNF
jgi:hypothetical protein